MEKIKDEKKNEVHIAPYFEEIMEKQRFLKERKRTVKKEVHININNLERVFSKKSNKTNKTNKPNKIKKKFMSSSSSQIHIYKSSNSNTIINLFFK
jgi:ribosomal protein L24